MAIPNTSGTPAGVLLDGMWYEVTADCNPAADLSGETVEGNASSGSTVFKHTRKPKTIKNIDVKMSVQDYNLACLIKSAVKISLPQGIKYTDGTVITGPGRSNFGEHSGADSKVSVDITFDDLVVAAG